MKVAIVHDWLYGGGAEKVVLELHKMYPNAPIYTSYCTDEWRQKLDNKVITGWLQYFGKLRKFLALPRGWWFRSLDLSDYDLVISSSGNGEAKLVQTKKSTTHVCYCHTPPHFYWAKYDEYLKNPGFKPAWLVRLGLKVLIKPLRRRDYKAAQKVDVFLANSTHIQQDIQQYYGRESTVIFPPIDVERFHSQTPTRRRGFVTMGRQVPYKRVDIIIEACNQLGVPLKVIGHGPDHARLVKLAGPTIEFLTNVSDNEMPAQLASALGFLFAANEDFGIAPIEAMAAGTPVIAYKNGGAFDYVVPGQTGEFFAQQTAESLAKTLRKFNAKNYSSKACQAWANHFSNHVFQQKIRQCIAKIPSK